GAPRLPLKANESQILRREVAVLMPFLACLLTPRLLGARFTSRVFERARHVTGGDYPPQREHAYGACARHAAGDKELKLSMNRTFSGAVTIRAVDGHVNQKGPIYQA